MITCDNEIRPNSNGHEYVDLGLPSGTLWAACNVGSEDIDGVGLYFGWGETKGYSALDEKSFCGLRYEQNGYNANENKVLDLEDDAAHIYMGGDWRMPTKEDFEELIQETSYSFEELNGVIGAKFIGKNGNSIFLPASGFRCYEQGRHNGQDGQYWSSSLNEERTRNAWYMFFSSSYKCTHDNHRYLGRNIRAILKP